MYRRVFPVVRGRRTEPDDCYTPRVLDPAGEPGRAGGQRSR